MTPEQLAQRMWLSGMGSKAGALTWAQRFLSEYDVTPKVLDIPTAPEHGIRCPICGVAYRKTYEEHTGTLVHRDAVWAATGREGVGNA